MKWMVLFFTTIIMNSCHNRPLKATATPVPIDKCSIFKNFIRDNWIQIDSGLYGIKSDSTIGKETIRIFRECSNECLIGKTKEEIYSLFGVPSKVGEGSSSSYLIQYYLKNECKNPVSGCIQLKIVLSKPTNKVIKVLPMIVEFVDY